MMNYLLPILVLTPLIMGLFLLNPFFPNEEKLIRRTTKGFSIFHFILTMITLLFFDFTNLGQNFEYSIPWINALGINFSLALDTISMLMVVLTSFIFIIAIYISKNLIKKSYQLYYALLLILQTAILGIFTSTDIFLFFLFWELELVPMYILLLKWGSANKTKTATKFILYTFLGSIFILIGFILMYMFNFLYTGNFDANIYSLDVSTMNNTLALVIFTLLFIGFGIKLPILPLHSWLPDAHSQAATPVSIILSSILLKIGAYGIFKFNFELFNETFTQLSTFIMILACINIIYASFCAVIQKDLKRIIAYSGIAHMGIFLLALSAMNEIGFTGAIYTIISHALISAGLFIIAGLIYKKCGTKNILKLNGIGVKMPILMNLSIPIILAAIGVPMFAGFISEFLSFTGAMLSDNKVISLLAITSVIISSIYILRFFHSIFFGELPDKFKKIYDINTHQKVILVAIILLILYFGIFPSTLTNIISDYIISGGNI